MMDLYTVIDQVMPLLQKHGRLTYRALKYQFHLDDEGLAALKDELIEAREVAIDHDGKMLVWKEDQGIEPAPSEARGSSAPATTQSPPPATYTPSHLAERIRAEQRALEARSGTDGERKTITALFADLKGSTALIEGLDPE